MYLKCWKPTRDTQEPTTSSHPVIGPAPQLNLNVHCKLLLSQNILAKTDNQFRRNAIEIYILDVPIKTRNKMSDPRLVDMEPGGESTQYGISLIILSNTSIV